MQKKITILLFVIVTIIYIIVGALLFLNIQIMEAPEVLIEIEFSEVNSEKAILHTTVNIDNPNSFEIVVKNLKVVTITPDGYEVARISIEGGDIGSHEKKTFTQDVFVAFDGHSFELLTSKLTGEVGANILFIQKTIPLNIGIVTSMENLINDLAAPSISITVDFPEITTEGINITALLDVYNPNSFDIFIEDILAELINEKGEKMGDVDVFGEGVVASKDYLHLNGLGRVLFETFNTKKLIFNMSGIAGAVIAGFEKNLSFDIQARVLVPDLEELLLSKDKSTVFSIMVDEKFTLKGIVFNLLLEVNNSFKVDLVLKDLMGRIYTVTDDTYNLIGENVEIENILAKAGTTGLSACEILVPFSKILPIDWSTDWIMASVSGRVGIKGINQTVYLEIRGYVSVHPFR